MSRPPNPIRMLRGWRGPSLALRILALLLGGLVVAQAVTLFLTLLLPPAPPQQYGLRDIAAALDMGLKPARTFERAVQAGPPDLSGGGWLTSPRSSADLAGLLGADREDVRLAFYTPLPFAGTVAAAPRGEPAEAAPPGMPVGTIPASVLIFAQAGPGGMPGGIPGGGLPGGGFPGGLPGGGFPGGLPGGGFPGGGAGRGFPGGRPGAGFPGATAGLPPRPAAATPGSGLPQGGVAVPAAAASSPVPVSAIPGGGAVTPGSGVLAFGRPPADGIGGGPGAFGRDRVGAGMPTGPAAMAGIDRGVAPLRATPIAPTVPVPVRRTPPADVPAAPGRTAASVTQVIATAPRIVDAPPAPPIAASPIVRADPRVAARLAAPPEPGALPVARASRGLFGLAPAPFVEGDFIAARRLADGTWVVVQPAAAGFPNAWQRRVGLWFLIAFAIVAPLGWLFARRLSGPLDRFADAAQRLGRDPSAAIVALDGPAEIGRAAHAFNLMQNRLRSFVDDRTAMVGAISHDLRTPLTRLRFRLEEVDDDAMREGMLDEVIEMEAMISSVLAFIRDASTPGVRERLDLRTLVDDVAEDAAMIGGQVTVDAAAPATVEVDVLGMRRLLANLVENALKYGQRAHIHVAVGGDEAIAAVIDEGPGLPDEELELVFQPFYRTAAARASDTRGTGLGLAVCRSIARAHGGDVTLRRGPQGFVAEVRVPLVYDSERALAA